MKTRNNQDAAAVGTVVRCAIYTRKSTEEGLEQEFNSLDAQRESGENYIASQRHEGWMCLPDRYDDGGFTGGNMDRPALKRLLADIQAGHVNCVVVYKVDRLSRSLLDFAKMIQTFDEHKVSFVSVTQQFNTATSMGRLILNVLLSFAQFEREIISERTRDKIAATRRKGKWAGGHPILGYDVDPRLFKLVVNPDEAVRIRAIFDLYRERQSLSAVLQEVDQRGWRNKDWTTRKGKEHIGNPFNKSTLYQILTNVAYIGRVKHKQNTYPGEHTAIVDPAIFEECQKILRTNGNKNSSPMRNKSGAMLRGLLRCAACNCSMTPSFVAKGNKRYRYYICSNAMQKGWRVCPSKSVPAGQIEEFVVDKIQRLEHDNNLVREICEEADRYEAVRIQNLTDEKGTMLRELARWKDELTQQVLGENGHRDASRLMAIQERIVSTESRLAVIDREIQSLRLPVLPEHESRTLLAAFRPAWDELAICEQAKIVGLLIDHVEYHGGDGKIRIKFHPAGIQAIARHLVVRI